MTDSVAVKSRTGTQDMPSAQINLNLNLNPNNNNNNNLVTRDAENGYGISRVNCEFLPTNNKSNFVFSIPTG